MNKKYNKFIGKEPVHSTKQNDDKNNASLVICGWCIKVEIKRSGEFKPVLLLTGTVGGITVTLKLILPRTIIEHNPKVDQMPSTPAIHPMTKCIQIERAF